LPGPGNPPKSSGEDEEGSSDQLAVISDYALEQNNPNPFNPVTIMSFQLPVASPVSLSIFNANGQVVKQVANGQFARGRHQIVWNATDASGTHLASGVYLCAITAGEFTAQWKPLLMK